MSRATKCPDAACGPAPVLAVGLLSSASLGVELLFLRWFAVLYWHHFAHMIISVALLGLGIAGAVLTLSQKVLLRRFPTVFQVSACGFAIAVPVVTGLIGRLNFNPLEVVWDPGQVWRLALVFLISAVPFMFSGFGIGLALRRYPAGIARLYRADLLGAAAGALAVLLLLMFVEPTILPRVLALPALAAALLVGPRRIKSVYVPALAVLIVFLIPAARLDQVMSPYKALPQALRVPGAHSMARQVSPAGISVALQSGQVPFRYAPGLSMLSPAEPPEQIALFVDGHTAGVIDKQRGHSEYLRWTTSHLPYLMAPDRPRVLILGAGGGTDAGQVHDASETDAVESSGALLRIVRALRERTHPAGMSVNWIEMEPRSFLAATRKEYDTIQISPFGTAVPYADAAQAMREHYLYTVEGLRLMLRRLSDQGVLGITVAVDLPPRAPVKLLATLAAAAEAEGIHNPSERLAMIRSWNTVTLVFRRQPLSAAQVAQVRDFCRQRAFDLVWLPDIEPSEINRVNVLDRPYFYEAASEILTGDRAVYLARYPFNVLPATDDKPYFGRYFKWRSFPGWWAGRSFGTAPFLEWSYLLAWMLVAVALLLAVPLIGLPLRPLVKSLVADNRKPLRHLARGTYFASLGMAFLLLEIVFIQKFVLFLGHPVVSMAVVVPSFLAFAGCGSGYSDRLRRWIEGWSSGRRCSPVFVAVLCMTLAVVIILATAPALFNALAGRPVFLRVAVSVAMIGALAFWMGMPFPLGLKRLGESDPDWIPLAWGINGLASVMSAVGAGLLAMHAGFRTVTLVALVLYWIAAKLEVRL